MRLLGLHPAVIALLVAAVQWVVMATAALLSLAPAPKSGMRASDRRMLISSVALLAVWLVVFDVRKAFQRRSEVQVSSESGGRVMGLCAAVTTGMRSSEVRGLLGAPDLEESDEDTRGPGAKRLSYKETRCMVHLVDDRVEWIE